MKLLLLLLSNVFFDRSNVYFSYKLTFWLVVEKISKTMYSSNLSSLLKKKKS